MVVSMIQLVAGPLFDPEVVGAPEVTIDWRAPLGTVTSCAVAILPSDVFTCTVWPPSAVRLKGTDPGIK